MTREYRSRVISTTFLCKSESYLTVDCFRAWGTVSGCSSCFASSRCTLPAVQSPWKDHPAAGSPRLGGLCGQRYSGRPSPTGFTRNRISKPSRAPSPTCPSMSRTPRRSQTGLAGAQPEGHARVGKKAPVKGSTLPCLPMRTRASSCATAIR